MLSFFICCEFEGSCTRNDVNCKFDKLARVVGIGLAQADRARAAQDNILACEVDYVAIAEADVGSIGALVRNDELAITVINASMLA